MRPVQNIKTFYNDSLILLRNIEIITVLMQEAEDRFVKGIGILVRDEMCARDDGELRIRDGARNKTGMLVFYHVVLAGKDKGGTLDLCELRRLHVWIIYH